MTSYEKVVKLACKPKAAPPKAKYLDPIIAATWDEGGAIHDPNAIIVFKALIVLHTMIRNGSTDNVLGYLSGSQVLRLSNVSNGNWDGECLSDSPYLDSRIHAYRDLKHDAVRVQSDSNRDARTTAAVNGSATPAPLQRSKTLAGRKLRSMTVEKGLLRETRAVHRMIDTLVACRFYLDDLEDPLTLTSLRMLAGNEGVINLLEHYFEMSHIDATEALTIYRHFCAQTELVVEYLGVARKLQNLLNVPVPNLKHAPVSLAGALQEYLDDPGFEQNRIEYKTNKDAVRRGGKGGAKAETPPVPALPAGAVANANGKATPDVLVDFFAAIEDTQPTMFNPATNSPNTAYFQQTAQNPNPFQRMQGQPTGFQPQPTGAFGAFQPQPTGAFPQQPQQGAFAQQPQLQLPQQQQQQTGAMLFGVGGGGGLQPQATGFNPRQQQQQQQAPFLRPHMTGGAGAANPFRASTMFSQGTGPAALSGSGSGAGPVPALPPFALGNNNNNSNNGAAGIARPASAPLSALAPAQTGSGSGLQPVKTHQTGTRNPFGSLRRGQPTMMEMMMGNFQQQQQQQQQQQAQQQQQQQGFDYSQSALGAGATDISGVATRRSRRPSAGGSSGSFSPTISAFNPTNSALGSPSPLGAGAGAGGGGGGFNAGGASSPVASQPTGSAVKAFKPSSSFGASLLETLPPIPGSAPGTPAITGAGAPPNMGAQQTGFFGGGGGGAATTNPTGAFGGGGGFGGAATSPTGGFGGTGAFGGAFGGGAFGSGSPAFGNPQQGQQQQQQNASLI
ncbi:ANTH domain-containing protein [Mycena olivaceomarginata]|nr:ANTH domain-containing protein [Mycena olivaceomarginata]